MFPAWHFVAASGELWWVGEENKDLGEELKGETRTENAVERLSGK